MMPSTNGKIRLFVTLEQRLYRDALLFDLVNQKDVDLVGESSKGSETLLLLKSCSPTTLIIEENLKDMDGLTISEIALSQHPGLTIILLVDSGISRNRLAIYLDSGIKSVISKTQSIQDLNQALSYTRNGQVYVERLNAIDSSSGKLFEGVGTFDTTLFSSLSEREQEVAKCIAEQMPINDIAVQLGVSNKTVHTYKERIFLKLGFERLPELIVYMKRLSFQLGLEE